MIIIAVIAATLVTWSLTYLWHRECRHVMETKNHRLRQHLKWAERRRESALAREKVLRTTLRREREGESSKDGWAA